MVDRQYLQSLRCPSPDDPLRVLVSACLTGILCGVDGSANGEYPSVLKLLDYRTIKLIRFCPEDFSFGTPREMCDIHGGNGHDVLDGKARVLTPSGKDWTEGMVKAAERMTELAISEGVELAVMMDVSAACGSQVIYDGNRYADEKFYQVGAGVCAARLQRAGFKVISQRDYAALEILYAKLDPAHKIDSLAIDHNQTEWYKSYFEV
jgi:uncharacterized protein YbbK (DUF523 family)